MKIEEKTSDMVRPAPPAHNGEGSPREKILAVAASLFARKGFSNVSIRDICVESGVSLPMVYYYFGSKQKLFEAVIQKNITLESFVKGLSEAIAAEPRPAGRLRAYIHYYLANFPERVMTTGYYLRDSAAMDRASVQRLVADFQQARKLLTGILAAGVAAGAFRPTDTKRATDCLTGALNGFLMRKAHFHEPFDEKPTADMLFDLFVHGLSAGKEEHG
ncbi:MAG: TetR/AcrR family transcriptional regulator [bacterium]